MILYLLNPCTVCVSSLLRSNQLDRSLIRYSAADAYIHVYAGAWDLALYTCGAKLEHYIMKPDQ